MEQIIKNNYFKFYKKKGNKIVKEYLKKIKFNKKGNKVIISKKSKIKNRKITTWEGVL